MDGIEELLSIGIIFLVAFGAVASSKVSYYDEIQNKHFQDLTKNLQELNLIFSRRNEILMARNIFLLIQSADAEINFIEDIPKEYISEKELELQEKLKNGTISKNEYVIENLKAISTFEDEVDKATDDKLQRLTFLINNPPSTEPLIRWKYLLNFSNFLNGFFALVLFILFSSRNKDRIGNKVLFYHRKIKSILKVS